MLVAIGEQIKQYDDDVQNENIAWDWELDDIEWLASHEWDRFAGKDNICWVDFGANWRDRFRFGFLDDSVEPFIFRDYDYSLYHIGESDEVSVYRTASHDWPCGSYEMLVAMTDGERESVEDDFENIYKILRSKGIMVGKGAI